MSLAQELQWERPWFSAVAANGEAVRQRWGAGAVLSHALNERVGTVGFAGTHRPPRFVAQSELPTGAAYESHIFQTGCVPTRDNLHDFFNGLVWLRFPCTKKRLNQLQAAEIAAAGVGAVRGRVRDALTLFDENAALLQAPDPVWDALLARDWQRLFVTLRPLWSEARLVLFGHALLEKLVLPYKSITAHVYRHPVPPLLGSDLARWDGWLAACLNREEMATKPFTPLPVLGVPGWWPENTAPGFYEDSAVFRAPRLQSTAASTVTS
ncbi:DUF3025 domain-containing protein [Hydrogenophaga sp.]|uniref:DUF3025 domain-containing protein n=1 Tax=Hydrogenophaga sp. TaxID=1904254 RepID=UPI002726160B|nr:DUF3025 domain-containing protein [Hydrogenophaga sp.]MDO8904112.1 DUF3025 domain-containing protein [Hydrogenophaga sp.]